MFRCSGVQLFVCYEFIRESPGEGFFKGSFYPFVGGEAVFAREAAALFFQLRGEPEGECGVVSFLFRCHTIIFELVLYKLVSLIHCVLFVFNILI